MESGVDIIVTMGIFALGFILGAMLCFVTRCMAEEDNDGDN